jgi:hypothetical protein
MANNCPGFRSNRLHDRLPIGLKWRHSNVRIGRISASAERFESGAALDNSFSIHLMPQKLTMILYPISYDVGLREEMIRALH